VAVQFVEWAGRVDPADPVVHMIRARIYAEKADREPSLMAQNVYKVRGPGDAARPQRRACLTLARARTGRRRDAVARAQSAQLESEKVLKSALWQYREREGRVLGYTRTPRALQGGRGRAALTARGRDPSRAVRPSLAHKHKLVFELAVVTSTVRWAALRTRVFVRQLLLFLGLFSLVVRMFPALRAEPDTGAAALAPPAAALPDLEAVASVPVMRPKGAAGGAVVRGQRFPPPHMHGHHACCDD